MTGIRPEQYTTISTYIQQYTIGERGVLVQDESGAVTLFPRETITYIKIYRKDDKLTLRIRDAGGNDNEFVLLDSNLKQTDVELLKKVFVL